MGFYEMIAWALIASFGGMAVIGAGLYGVGLVVMKQIEKKGSNK